jgi:hypothetical protein
MTRLYDARLRASRRHSDIRLHLEKIVLPSCFTIRAFGRNPEQPRNESTQMRECVVQRNLDYAMNAALAKTNAATVELKTKRDVFPERRNGREGVNYGCFPFERVGW